jgi:glutamine synthetase
MLSPDDVVSNISQYGVKWLDLQFTDLVGVLRHVTVSVKLLTPNVFSEGLGKLDGSSVRGFSTIEESDLVLKPIPTTFALMPWSSGIARMLCSVWKSGERLVRDPRYVSERVDEYFMSSGLRPYVSAELEYFIFDKVNVVVDSWRQELSIVSSESYWSTTVPFNRGKDGYYVTYPKDKFQDLKLEIAEVLEKYFGLTVEVVHHEVASAQHEINFNGSNTTGTSDNIQTVKYVVKSLTYRKGYIATFMPKPVYGDNGSGMHVHVSIWRGDENLFYDPNDEYVNLSQYARYFIGGLIEHGRALSAIVSPTVNSYKRLVPGYEAPVYLVWSKANRSAAVRIPAYSNSYKSKRVEYRPPDPSANPYLALSAILLAGVDGVNKKLDPGDPVDENVYRMTPLRRRELGIKELPRSLDEALDELECDNEWLRPIFPKELIDSYVEVKREEVKKVTTYPTPIEVYHYIDV